MKVLGTQLVVSQEPLSHLNAPYRTYALLPASERVQWIRQDRWIHYSRAEQVLNRLADLLTYPARDRMPCLLLFGATIKVALTGSRRHLNGDDWKPRSTSDVVKTDH